MARLNQTTQANKGVSNMDNNAKQKGENFAGEHLDQVAEALADEEVDTKPLEKMRDILAEPDGWDRTKKLMDFLLYGEG
jgi:hypothetical protein